MVNKKWAVKRLTVNLTSIERQKLSQYCAKTGRSMNDVIRELLRSLKVDSDEASEISPDSEVSELARLQK
ncbi:CopG family transcriptional regulator [Nostoc flagelliforme FACHB-838]|uniref:CopG family transcriptional regulator n=1 Tax=Nostoc flagelliforme FACHB-838 TaxID=2692904 RepID=A0ABR8E5C0_9NOSO|nr:CopG family transcriptional regulator [Nostoc flagelliforme]MBD2536942.1 CopG family transcriptional regulator [Nostoc flagelliforme FACHB-838]